MDSKTFYRVADPDEQLRPLAVRPRQAAAMLKISISSLRRLTLAGEIPKLKHGNKVLYRVAALDAWLHRRESLTSDGSA